VPEFSSNLRQLIEKLLIHRGRRNATCRVFPPAGGIRSYSIVLEEAGIREQFFIENAHVERFAESGNEQYVLTYVRAGIRNLDRLVTKKKAARGR
jgi:hypothetical protein